MGHGRSFGVLALVAASVAAPLACGSNTPDAKASFSLGGDAGACPPGQACAAPANDCQPGQPCAPPSCPPGQACPPPQGSAGQLGTVHTTDPNALASLLAAAAAAGSAWLGPASAIADPAEAGLRAAAAKYAPGMSADGQVAKGDLAEGGHVDFIVNLEPSKCYTIVAYGAGVVDLDVNLLAPPLYNFLAGQDGMAGPTAVIGAAPKPMCPVIPLAVPYKVDLHAKQGGGTVAAQLYSKPK
ncbi:MAG: hypothetical protein KF782_09455 [Labilithrix sp.]|nr:hypothetical protein [Labilithrix sp.]